MDEGRGKYGNRPTIFKNKKSGKPENTMREERGRRTGNRGKGKKRKRPGRRVK